MGKKEMTLHPFRIKQAQLLIFENITDRKMREAAEAGCNPTLKKKKKILFSDEKLFSMEQSYNHQNDRIW